MTSQSFTETPSSFAIIDSADRRFIEQVGLTLGVWSTTRERDSFELASQRLHDLYVQIGSAGNVRSLFALVGGVVSKQDQTPQDRENVLGGLAMILELVLRPDGVDEWFAVESSKGVPGPQNDAFALPTAPRTSEAVALDQTAPSTPTKTRTSRKNRNDQMERRRSNRAPTPSKAGRSRKSRLRWIDDLTSDGWKRVAPKGAVTVARAVADALKVGKVKAVRESGACLDVRAVSGEDVLLEGQVRGHGGERFRHLNSDPDDGNLIAEFSFYTKSVAA